MTNVAPPAVPEQDKSILYVIQQAALVLGIAVPDVAFGSSIKSTQELTGIATECARRIVDAHDWSTLRATGTLQGTGLTSVSLPSDFERMCEGASIWSSASGDKIQNIVDPDNFLKARSRSSVLPCMIWIQTGTVLEVYPALAASEILTFQYTRNVIALTSTGDGRFFEADSDIFLLDSRLLTLGIVWEWRKQKGFPYAEDMATYEAVLLREIAADNGQRGYAATARAEGAA